MKMSTLDDTTMDPTDTSDGTATTSPDSGDDTSTAAASSDGSGGQSASDPATSDGTDPDASDPAQTDPTATSDAGQQPSDSTGTTPSGPSDPSAPSAPMAPSVPPGQDWSDVPGGSGHDGAPDTWSDGTQTDPASTDTSSPGASTGSPGTGTPSPSPAGQSTPTTASPATGSTTNPGGGGAGSSSPTAAQPSSGNYTSTLFTFQPNPGESIGARIVRCCNQALAAGPMGQTQRSDFYRDFIACNQEKTQQAAQALTKVTTSCAMFVRAVREWCGAPPVGPYRPGTGMFVSMGNVSLSSPAFVKLVAGATPNPGDYFYIATSQTSNDGHTGIFISQNSDGSWQTAEGGGPPDGTTCRLSSRTISGSKFSNDARTLWGWFDCTKVGLPTS
jgi:hypothetical protein